MLRSRHRREIGRKRSGRTMFEAALPHLFFPRPAHGIISEQVVTRNQPAKSCPPLCKLLEKLSLREHRVPELLDQHAFIRRVDIAESIGRAEEQDLSFGHRGVQRVDERDRTACRDVYSFFAPCGRQRCTAGLVCSADGFGREPITRCASGDSQWNPEWTE